MYQESRKQIRIAASEFLLADKDAYIEFCLNPGATGYTLTSQTHKDRRSENDTNDLQVIAVQVSLSDAFKRIFQQLRSLEIENGLYQVLHHKKLPLKFYAGIINQWVNRVNHADLTFFSIHGNYSKFGPKPSAATKAWHLKVYEQLKSNWQRPPANTLWIEELIKKEISEYNEAYFENGVSEELTIGDFLKKFYPDFEDQIDRYLLHLDVIKERNVVIKDNNRLGVQDRFEHHLLEKVEHLISSY
ncbi:MAG TPA: hypothetical protein PK325_19270 [Cyclobacteriaceae bacterium]|nr:hypothetical protein [Cyclobacteriaceae bacterium]HMV09325.1 hypothetical protein [Cyclobacteriaceae bacterium]HMX01874.1 hypothetical protein [Cyclobacteriaceae bacterium]HMX50798.1 hypothetical protein [Cyclobacteriaceae bacterium]HMY94698.1 hypothetical protein [Cyclobacteriaceae bacterium]